MYTHNNDVFIRQQPHFWMPQGVLDTNLEIKNKFVGTKRENIF